MLAQRVLAIGRTSCYAKGVADRKDVLMDSVGTLLKRALRMRCPRCVVLILMPPQNLQLYRIALAASALVLYAATMPLRKSIAIALNYFNTR